MNFKNDGGSSYNLIAAHIHHRDCVRGGIIAKLLTVEHLCMRLER